MSDIISHLRPHASKRVFKKHSIILYQGEAPRLAYVILSGVVKVYSINNAGEEQIVAFETRDDLLPAPWVFYKSTTTLYYYETLSDVEVLAISREELHILIKSSGQLRDSMLDYFVTGYTGHMMRITALEQSRAREKIMFTLYYLIFRYGKEKKAGIYTIDIKLTHSVVASLVGLTRETTTNELSKLKAEKVLQYAAHQYSVDKAKLERLLGEDSFEDVLLNRG